MIVSSVNEKNVLALRKSRTILALEGGINHLAATKAWEVLSQDRIYASILVLGPFQTHTSEKIP